MKGFMETSFLQKSTGQAKCHKRNNSRKMIGVPILEMGKREKKKDSYYSKIQNVEMDVAWRILWISMLTSEASLNLFWSSLSSQVLHAVVAKKLHALGSALACHTLNVMTLVTVAGH